MHFHVRPAWLSVILAAGTSSDKDGNESEPLGRGGYFTDREGNIRVFEAAVIRSDIHSSGDLWIGRKALIDGNAIVEGDLIMESDSRINGSISVTGSANFKQNSSVGGKVEITGAAYRGNNPPDHLFRRKYPPAEGDEDVSPAKRFTETDVQSLLHGRTLQEGSITIVHEKRAEASYAIVRYTAADGIPCMIIGREPPDRLQSVRGIRVDEENVIWLTNLVGRRCVNPTHLGSVLNALTRFLDSNSKGLVLIDGIEYLITNNGFDQVLKFINKIEDMIITSGIAFLVTLDPRTLDAQHLALIERGAESIITSDRQQEERTPLAQDFEERLKEESLRRQQLEDRLDGYLYRIESAITAAQARPQGERMDAEEDIRELEGARDTIRSELKTLEQRIEEKERELLETLDRKIGEIRGEDSRKDLITSMEEQLRENSELLLKAVLLAEKLSAEKLQKVENAAHE